MKPVAFPFAFFLACTVSGCATTVPYKAPAGVYRFEKPIDTLLIGQWNGTLKSRPPLTTPDKAEPVHGDVGLIVAIGPDQAAVQVSIAGRSFDAAKAMTGRVYSNAIVQGYSIEDDKESSGRVFGAWTLLLTAKTDDTIIAEWTEVRNFLSPSGVQAPMKSTSAVGVLQRVP